ncbi:MAG: DUF2934 domain-containing protein [Steroidobacteraceae bacterium]|nr:DUF2934 domain-containing protein [Steroidobacteraceae bacterium]MDW8257865.1 DUF2934 domain-containing protein [Gammaproteobacteria bacterium]
MEAKRKRTTRGVKARAMPDGTANAIITRSGAFIEPSERWARIAEAAYYRAERRGFDPGHEIEDWLAAEAEIDAALTQGETPTLCGDATARDPQRSTE